MPHQRLVSVTIEACLISDGHKPSGELAARPQFGAISSAAIQLNSDSQAEKALSVRMADICLLDRKVQGQITETLNLFKPQELRQLGFEQMKVSL